MPVKNVPDSSGTERLLFTKLVQPLSILRPS